MSEFVFRVYEPFHDSSESGTYEYGIYSSHSDAIARVEAVWTQKEYPQPEKKNKGGWYASFQMDSYTISISKVEIDKDIDSQLVGYT